MPPREFNYIKPRGRQKVEALARYSANYLNISLRIEPTRAATQACIVIGIPLEVNYWVLYALITGNKNNLYSVDKFDQSVVAFAAFEAVKEKLSGSPVDAIKNKVIDVKCSAHNGEFIISVTCASTLAAARKCASLILKNLKWASLYSRYSDWCKVLEIRPEKAAFSNAAYLANSAVKHKINIVITGKIETDFENTDKSVKNISRFVINSPPKDRGRSRTIKLSDIGIDSNILAKKFQTFKSPGILGVAVLSFVDTIIRGEQSHLVSGTLFIHIDKSETVKKAVKNKTTMQKHTNASNKVLKYASSYSSLGKEARGSLVYTAAQGCHVSTGQLIVTYDQDDSLATLNAINQTFSQS